jgi:hypothetical protein
MMAAVTLEGGPFHKKIMQVSHMPNRRLPVFITTRTGPDGGLWPGVDVTVQRYCFSEPYIIRFDCEETERVDTLVGFFFPSTSLSDI